MEQPIGTKLTLKFLMGIDDGDEEVNIRSTALDLIGNYHRDPFVEDDQRNFPTGSSGCTGRDPPLKLSRYISGPIGCLIHTG